jgi:hypothetical protein
MAFKLNRPFGNVATFRRGDEFFDWMVWYDATTEYGVSGMVWQDDKPINTVAKVLEMGRQAFLLAYDEIYAAPETVTKSSLAAAVAEAAGIPVTDLGLTPVDPMDLRGMPTIVSAGGHLRGAV